MVIGGNSFCIFPNINLNKSNNLTKLPLHPTLQSDVK